ncbi:TPA: hypothetical protein N0F65_009714 [Lagenidium giganteum]|uniref:Calponin-homology (CH) domain-containing protein n=1 Tax=Lagenidium giganteum TaxID=4803 RepID=A0AAV2YDK5_9STRA|nr:TPA: hypothetical protein N0F65_009714 [Lagenidium giganteum]
MSATATTPSPSPSPSPSPLRPMIDTGGTTDVHADAPWPRRRVRQRQRQRRRSSGGTASSSSSLTSRSTLHDTSAHADSAFSPRKAPRTSTITSSSSSSAASTILGQADDGVRTIAAAVPTRGGDSTATAPAVPASVGDQEGDEKENQAPNGADHYPAVPAAAGPAAVSSPATTSTSARVLGKRKTRPLPHAMPATSACASPSGSARRVPIRQRPPAAVTKTSAIVKRLFPTNVDDPAISTTTDRTAMLIVNDLTHVARLAFGAVGVHGHHSVALAVDNPSDFGSVRVRFEGFHVVRTTPVLHEADASAITFRCDVASSVVSARSRVPIRVICENNMAARPRVPVAVEAVLTFIVNDKFRLQCNAKATLTAPSEREQPMDKAPSTTDNQTDAHGTLTKPTESASSKRGIIHGGKWAVRASSAPTFISNQTGDVEKAPMVPLKDGRGKRKETLMMDFTPPRRPKVKRHKGEQTTVAATPASAAKGAGMSGGNSHGCAGMWWKKRKILFDDNWMAKQEEGFTKWINYVLVNSAYHDLVDNVTVAEADYAEHDQHDGHALARRRQSRVLNFASLRILAQKRMELVWERAALDIYHSPAMDNVLFALQREITARKLAARDDRPVYADVGLQEDLFNLLNNYHPIWLCLGLQVVLGQAAFASENCSLRQVMAHCTKNPTTKMPRVLRRLILQRLVHDPQLATKFRLVKRLKTPLDALVNVMGSAKKSTAGKRNISGRAYFDALMENFVLKFLMVVLVLDKAVALKTEKFIHFPCLFRVGNASTSAGEGKKIIKSSAEMVSVFCRMFLSNEGRIDKHLRQLGYSVSHSQKPLDEVNLEIQNLAVDLRDGVRLAKLLEVITSSSTSPPAQGKHLSSFLRVPAVSRLQKVHNVEICLHFLQEKCGHGILHSIKSSCAIQLDDRSSFSSVREKEEEKLTELLAKDIVDGHREKTLALLWKLISCFQLQSLVDSSQLRSEIETIKNRMSFRALDFYEKQIADPASRIAVGVDKEEQVYWLLLDWCRAVAANYFVEVHNFTGSFSDGKVLCYLLHYYHPMLLCKAEILKTTSDSQEEHNNDDPEIAGFHILSTISMDQALENERSHFRLVNERVKQLGEIPVLVPEHYHSQNPPEEKMVVTFVCYLQSRLMESSKEIHAACRLKRWWRSPFLQRKLRMKKNASARIIQRFWYTSSQKRLMVRRCRKVLRSARMISSVLQAWVARKHLLHARRAVIKIQRAFRRGRTASLSSAPTLQSLKKACCVIAQAWCMFRCRQFARLWRSKELGARRTAASRVQHAWKVFKAREELSSLKKSKAIREKHAASVIQRQWLRHKAACLVLHKVRQTAGAFKITALFRLNAHQRQAEREALERFRRMLQEQEEKKCASRLVKWWRRLSMALKLDTSAQVMKNKIVAARRIQSWRRNLQQATALATYACQLKHTRQEAVRRLLRWWTKILVSRKIEAFARAQHARRVCAAQTIQAYRRHVLLVRRILTTAHQLRRSRLKATTKIQVWWTKSRRAHAVYRFARLLALRRNIAARRIQSAWKLVRCNRERAAAATRLQRWFRGRMVAARLILEAQTIKTQRFEATACIKKWWIKQRIARNIAQFAEKLHTDRCVAAKRIQLWFKALSMVFKLSQAADNMKKQRKAAAVKMCGWWVRQTLARRMEQSAKLLHAKREWAVLRIQKWVATIKAVRMINGTVQTLRAVRMIEAWFARLRLGRCLCLYADHLVAERRRSLSAAFIQQWWKRINAAQALTHRARGMHDSRVVASFCISRWWRMQRLASNLSEVASIMKEKMLQSTLRIQTWWKIQRQATNLLNAAITMKRARAHAAARIQVWWRAVCFASKCMRTAAAIRVKRQAAASRLTKWLKNYQLARRVAITAALMKKERHEAALRLVQWWCRSRYAQKLARTAQRMHHQRQSAASTISRWWRQVRMAQQCAETAKVMKQRVRMASLIAKWWKRSRIACGIHAVAMSMKVARAGAVTGIARWWRRTALASKLILAASVMEDERRSMNMAKRSKAASSIQFAWRRFASYRHERVRHKAAQVVQTWLRRLQKQKHVARARSIIARWLRCHVIPKHRKFTHERRAVKRVQAWWRGTAVRMRPRSPEVARRCKKIAAMTLVSSSSPSTQSNDMVTACGTPTTRVAPPQQQPLTLGARLEMALHVLMHGKRLHEMLFACHTIEMCTRYSRECCWKCVHLKIPNTIFAAIRGLNRSRPHVELLHQLLLVLRNLTAYQTKELKSSSGSPSKVSVAISVVRTHHDIMEDVRAVDALLDLLHIHRDSQQVFVLSAKVLKFYLTTLGRQVKTASNASVPTTHPAVEPWHDAYKRLHGLHELLTRKAAFFAAAQVATSASMRKRQVAATPTKLSQKMNPKQACALTTKLLRHFEP